MTGRHESWPPRTGDHYMVMKNPTGTNYIVVDTIAHLVLGQHASALAATNHALPLVSLCDCVLCGYENAIRNYKEKRT